MEGRIGERQGGGRDRHVHLPRRAHPGADRSVYVGSQGLTGKLRGAVGPYKLLGPAITPASSTYAALFSRAPTSLFGRAAEQRLARVASAASPTTALPGSSIESHGSRLERSGLCCRRGEA